jgi:hypothetical protein
MRKLICICRRQAVPALSLVAMSMFRPVLAGSAEFPNPLPPDMIPKVETLPEKYPTDWAFLNFPYNRIELRNVGSDSREVRGELQAHDSTVMDAERDRRDRRADEARAGLRDVRHLRVHGP